MARLSLALSVLGLTWFGTSAVRSADLAAEFRSPPHSARPWVYWFWLEGNVTREGITADLEAMRRAGIGGPLFMDGDMGNPKGPNRLIGDEQLPEDSDRDPNGLLKSWPTWLLDGKPSPAGRTTFATCRVWKKDSPLQESGLLGPVKLQSTQKVVLESPLPKIRVAPDGRSFVDENGKPFVPMGLTYYRPGTGWAPQVWNKFDAEATRQDFLRMKAMGVNCVRVFLTFGSFFTEPDRLSPEGLAKFDQFLGIAERAGIYVHPTGPDHWEGVPGWAAGDRIADERILAALERFWKEFAQRYRGRAVLFAYDLLNEPAVAWDTPVLRTKWNAWLLSRYGTAEKTAEAWGVAPAAVQWGKQPPPEAKDAPGDRLLLDYQHFREGVADEWTRRQAQAIKTADPQALVTVGLIQWSVPALLPGVRHYAAFRPQRQAPFLDFLEVHFYPLESGFYEYSGKESEDRNLAYLESVVREVAAAGKPVVVAEFGWYGGGRLTIDQGRHPAASDQQQARWCRLAVETSKGLATGWLNWGLYDQPEARDVSQLTGLLTAEGEPKAWAREFKTLAASLAGRPVPSAAPGPRPDLDWDRCATSTQAGREFRDAYYRAFLR